MKTAIALALVLALAVPIAAIAQDAVEIVTTIGVTMVVDITEEVTTPGGIVVEVTRPYLVTLVGLTADGTPVVDIRPIDDEDEEEVEYLLPVDSENPGYVWVLETSDGITWGISQEQADGTAEKIRVDRDGRPVYGKPSLVLRGVGL